MLTDERILELFNEWFRREKGGDTYADCWNACARAIEAEVLQAQEPVAWFVFAGNNGPVPLELWGFDLKACKNAVLENARSVGWKGTVEGYLFQKGWAIRPLGFFSSYPPAPCPKCAEFALFPNVDALRQCMLDTADENDALRSKFDLLVIERDAQAVLISDQQAGVEKQTEISNNFAAQVRQKDETITSLRVEVNHRQSLLRESNRNCAEHAGVVWTQNVTIAQQAALIEKYERVLVIERDRYRADDPEGGEPESIAEALAAIATHRGQS